MHKLETIDVWLTEVSIAAQPSLTAAYLSLICDDERDRYRRLPDTITQSEYLTSRALLRIALSECHPIAPRDWRFSANAYGRPEISRPRSARHIHFNLTHSHGVIALVAARDRDVGIDIECVHDCGLEERIAKRFFSPFELQQLTAAPLPVRPYLFWANWVLKESYIKAHGMGLAMSLRSFAFQVLPDERLVRLQQPHPDDTHRWTFFLFSPVPHFLLALTVENYTEEFNALNIRTGVPLRYFKSLLTEPMLTSVGSVASPIRDTTTRAG